MKTKNMINYQKIGENIDEIFSKYYFIVIVILGILLAVNYLRVAFILADNWSGWSIGEWVINYDYGFVRRGLSGEFVRFLSILFQVEINWIVLSVQCLIYFIFIYLFIFYIKNKIITFWYFLLCFSPGFLLFSYYDGMAVGRKEIILYLIYIVWVSLNDSNKINNYKIIFFAIIFFILTIFHEALFFYSMYFYLAYVFIKPKQVKFFKHIYFIPLASALAMFLTYIYAQTVDGQLLCAHIVKHALNENICDGAMSYGSIQPIEEILKYIHNFELNNLIDISLVLCIIAIPNLLYVASVDCTNVIKRNFIFYVLCLILISFPLFIIAIDWGRWISIHTTLIAITLLITLKDKSNTIEKILIRDNKIIYCLVGLLIFSVLSFSISIKHCCGDNFINILGPFKKFSHTLRLIK